VFASTRLKGKQPRVANMLVEDYLRPAAVKVGVLKEGEKVRFGFHNLRHSLANFLVRKGTDVKTVQKMLRHSDVATTLGIYAHSMSEDRLAAQDDMLAAMMTPVKRGELSDHTRETQVSDTARLLPYSPSLVQNFGLSLQVR
jgi:integrase